MASWEGASGWREAHGIFSSLLTLLGQGHTASLAAAWVTKLCNLSPEGWKETITPPWTQIVLPYNESRCPGLPCQPLRWVTRVFHPWWPNQMPDQLMPPPWCLQ